MTGFLPGRNGAKAPAPIASPRTLRGYESHLYQYRYNKSATTQSVRGFQHFNVEEYWLMFNSVSLQAPVVPAIRHCYPARTPCRNSTQQRHPSLFYPVCSNVLCLTLATPLTTSISAAENYRKQPGRGGFRRAPMLGTRGVSGIPADSPLQTRRDTLHECAPVTCMWRARRREIGNCRRPNRA